MRYAKRLAVLVAVVTLGTSAAHAEAENRLTVGVGLPGTDSFAFGTELWAMSQITLKPVHGIVLESEKISDDRERLALLQAREIDAALVYGRIPETYADEAHAIMALWPRGVSAENAKPVHILVHRDVAADVVYIVTKAMFEHANYFKSAHDRIGVGLPNDAIIGLDMPLHEGASRYYRESGFGLNAAVAAAEEAETVTDGKLANALTFRNFDDAALEPNEIEQIAAACRQALELGVLSSVLGDLTNTGCEVYQDKLLDAIAASGAAGQGAKTPNGDGKIFDSSVGQGGPSIRWAPSGDDGVDEVNPAAALKPSPTTVLRQPTM